MPSRALEYARRAADLMHLSRHSVFLAACGFLICCDQCDGDPPPPGGEECGYTYECDPEYAGADADCNDECARDCQSAGFISRGWCLEDDARCICECNGGACSSDPPRCVDGIECPSRSDEYPQGSEDERCEAWCAESVCDMLGDVRSGACNGQNKCECICGYTGISTCNYIAP
jgi:hypothetical protein